MLKEDHKPQMYLKMIDINYLNKNIVQTMSYVW